MAVQSVGGVSPAAPVAPTAAAPSGEVARRNEPERKDSTLVISKVTKTNPDGSTITTITYADGHTKTETTPAKFADAASKGLQGEGRVTAVDILA